MNANSVLGKIMTLLSVEKVSFTYAKLEDGTIVESPTFDVGEPVEVVTEEGKTPAPDGEHNLFLRDEEGNEVHIRVITKDGIITERENVEELEEETKEEEDIKTEEMSEETLEPQPLPGEPGYEEMKVQMADYGKKLEEMAYRIDELEKYISDMKKTDMEDVEDEEEEDITPMNGAPLEMSKQTLNLGKPSKNEKIGNAQASFLSKLYK
jgi:hypothetical protein